jgi:hypothetical protein
MPFPKFVVGLSRLPEIQRYIRPLAVQAVD